MVGKLEKVDLRKVWIKEAKDFTTWLANNLDILSDQIVFSLSLVEREKSAGASSNRFPAAAAPGKSGRRFVGDE